MQRADKFSRFKSLKRPSSIACFNTQFSISSPNKLSTNYFHPNIGSTQASIILIGIMTCNCYSFEQNGQVVFFRSPVTSSRRERFHRFQRGLAMEDRAMKGFPLSEPRKTLFTSATAKKIPLIVGIIHSNIARETAKLVLSGLCTLQ